MRAGLATIPGALAALTLLAAPVCAAARPGEPAVSCHISYGGQTVIQHAQPTQDPYGVMATPVGSYFLFKLVWQTAPRDLAAVKIYVYADLPRGPSLLHQFALPWPQARRRTGPQGFTGWQRVHEPMRDGELLYWCGQDGTAPAPAPATAPDQATPARPSRPARPAPPAARAAREDAVRLIFVGDILLDDGPGRTIAAGGDPLAPFDALLRDADFTIGNLECPIAAADTGQALDNKIYTFRAAPETVSVLQHRFQALSVANNHSGDYGHAAFLETLAHVQAAGIATFGGGRTLREAHAPLWIERKGLRIAVLGYNEFKPRSFEAGPTWPGIAWSEDEQTVADIRAARQAGADVVIPFMHWGWERETRPSERQRQLARRMIDAGADAVIGGHPHVTQGTDHYKGRPIIWSLGNFVFDGFDLPAAKVGWLLRLEIDARGVRRWNTVEARMDAAGTPHPAPEALTPSGTRGHAKTWP